MERKIAYLFEINTLSRIKFSLLSYLLQNWILASGNEYSGKDDVSTTLIGFPNGTDEKQLHFSLSFWISKIDNKYFKGR